MMRKVWIRPSTTSIESTSQIAVRRPKDAAGLAIDADELDWNCPSRLVLVVIFAITLATRLAPKSGLRAADDLAAAVGVEDRVLGKQLLEGGHVALLRRGQEALRAACRAAPRRARSARPAVLEVLLARVTSWRQFASLRSMTSAISR